MTTKRVRLNEEVHEQLLYMKEKSNAKSINDVIESLIRINKEIYLNNGNINAKDNKITLLYNKGQLIEIEVHK